MTIIIAVDGPSASGKGTLTKRLAAKIGFDFLDTGKLYRALAYHALKNGFAPNEIDEIVALANQIDFTDIASLPLSQEEVGQMASKIAVEPKVRKVLNHIQRDFPIGRKGAIIDGRDIGTLIFPNADCKFFITASLEERAMRRYKQLQNDGKNTIFDQVLKELRERDERDLNRKTAPTVPASDAIIIDTSNLDIEAVLELVYTKTREILKDKIK
jgi:cytidylate kinase